MAPRVVITGIGLVTCLGTGSQLVWKNLLAGRCGIMKLTDPAYSRVPSRVAGVVMRGDKEGEFNFNNMSIKGKKNSASPASLYALRAADEAVSQAKLDLSDEETQLNTGVAIGNSFIDLDRIVQEGEIFQKAYNKVNPYFIPQVLTNMTAGLISIQFSAKGPNHAVATACTTGVHSIGDAFRFIRNGDAQAMICGSSEASIVPLKIAAFCRMRALSTSFNDRPLEASRPFDAQRDGFVISEGACVMVLENLDQAINRGASPIAEVLGYGLSSDAYHVTAPSPNGEGAFRCMRAALREAQVDPVQVGYINVHATSTPLGDALEAQAIHMLFHRDNPPKLPLISSTKGATGHMLGGSGSTEAAFAALACKHKMVPPTLNLNDLSTIPFQLQFVSNTSREWRDGDEKCIAVTNSFGFGGTNASLCISEYIH